MPAQIMYGQPVADAITDRVRRDLEAFQEEHNIVPRIDVVQVGRSPASTRYVARKLEACERLGMRAQLHLFEEDVTGQELKDHVMRLSDANYVHGILVQLPLPPHVEEPSDPNAVDKFQVFDAIAPEKDIDGVSRYSVPELYRAQQNKLMFLSCTALAVRRMMAFYGIETEGKVAVIVGRNDITAKPLHHMLGGRMCNATAIWCHRYTRKEDHDTFMRAADIVITSVGAQHYRVTADMVKRGAAVIDVGTRVDPTGKLKGDVDFEGVKELAAWITPVPKGVGPVTVAALTENLLRAAKFCAGTGAPGYEF